MAPATENSQAGHASSGAGCCRARPASPQRSPSGRTKLRAAPPRTRRVEIDQRDAKDLGYRHRPRQVRHPAALLRSAHLDGVLPRRSQVAHRQELVPSPILASWTNWRLEQVLASEKVIRRRSSCCSRGVGMAEADKGGPEEPVLGSGPGSGGGAAFETEADNPPPTTAVEGSGPEVGSEGSDSKGSPLGPGVPDDQSPTVERGQETQEKGEGPAGMMAPGSEDQGAG